MTAWIASLREPKRAVWILPAVVILIVLVLSALGVSGSSTSLLTPDGVSDSSVRIGTPRQVRSDEWLVRTPLILGQAARDFPRDAAVGVGTHDMSVLSELPTATWPEAFRPHQFGYFVAPVANGFAFEWWFPAAVLIIGAYSLVLVIWRDLRWAIIAGIVLFASPVFHWWYQPVLFDIVGWGAIAIAAYLASLSARRRVTRWSLVAVAAYATCVFGLSLYPPAQIPLIYAFGAVLVGVAVPNLRDRTWSWRPMVVHGAVIGGAAAVVMGAFVVTRHAALADIAGTVYPGARREAGGNGDVRMLFTGWFGTQYASDAEGMRGALFPNESEASSFLAFGILLLPAMAILWPYLNEVGRRFRILIVGLAAVSVLLLGHYLFGWPSILSRLTLLDRVTEPRMIPALAIISVLLLVAFARSFDLCAVPFRRRVLAGAVTVAALSFLVARLGVGLEHAGAPVGTRATLVAVVIAGAVACLWFWRPIVAAALLAVVSLVMIAAIHPLVRGFDHVTGSEFATTVAEVHSTDAPSTVWLTDDYLASSVLTALGVDVLSGVNLYPDHEAWKVLDPTGRYETVWNRYSHTRWILDPTATAPVISLVQDDVVDVRIAPCDPALATLGVEHLLAQGDLDVACMVPGAAVVAPSGAPLTLWSR